MKATVYYALGDVRVETVPDSTIEEPTDAIVRITHACIGGSDLWFYRGEDQWKPGWRTGHEWMGIVEAVGADVRTLQKGDRVLAPFAFSEGSGVVSDRDEAAIEQVQQMTKGGAEALMECVGTASSLGTAMGIARPGASIGFVGVPHGSEGVKLQRMFRSNISLHGGVAPARAYIPELLSDVIVGKLDRVRLESNVVLKC